MPRLATLAFLFPSAFAAAAGIQIQSRTSTLNAVRVDPDPALRWNETATATALGEFSLSTPHGGTFSGSSWRTCFSSPCSESRSSSLEVTFVITGPPADLLLEMWGTSWPPGNAILRITNLAGTVEHFNADWIATNPGSSQSPQEWSSATWTGQTGPLAPGYGFLGGSVILQRFDGFIFVSIFNTLSLARRAGRLRRRPRADRRRVPADRRLERERLRVRGRGGLGDRRELVVVRPHHRARPGERAGAGRGRPAATAAALSGFASGSSLDQSTARPPEGPGVFARSGRNGRTFGLRAGSTSDESAA